MVSKEWDTCKAEAVSAERMQALLPNIEQPVSSCVCMALDAP